VRKRKDRAKVLQQRTIDAPVEGLSLSPAAILFYLKTKRRRKKKLFTNKRGTERTNERGQQTN
jgi:hypothetical protein